MSAEMNTDLRLTRTIAAFDEANAHDPASGVKTKMAESPMSCCTPVG